MKIRQYVNKYQKFDTDISKILTFALAIRYDTIHMCRTLLQTTYYLHDASDILASLDVWPSVKPTFIMRPSSLGGGRILRRTLSVRLSVCLSVCPSVCPSIPLSLPSVTSRHLANYNDTHVLFRTRRGPHIVRPSRPHKILL